MKASIHRVLFLVALCGVIFLGQSAGLQAQDARRPPTSADINAILAEGFPASRDRIAKLLTSSYHPGQTIMKSRTCLMLAFGKGKAQAVANMAEGPVSAMCPASILQMHRQTILIVDSAAASCLRKVAFYPHVNSKQADASKSVRVLQPMR